MFPELRGEDHLSKLELEASKKMHFSWRHLSGHGGEDKTPVSDASTTKYETHPVDPGVWAVQPTGSASVIKGRVRKGKEWI